MQWVEHTGLGPGIKASRVVGFVWASAQEINKCYRVQVSRHTWRHGAESEYVHTCIWIQGLVKSFRKTHVYVRIQILTYTYACIYTSVYTDTYTDMFGPYDEPASCHCRHCRSTIKQEP